MVKKKKKSGVENNSLSSLNRTNLLGYFALALIIVSLANIGMRLTGMALTDTATVNVTIGSSASISFTTNNIDFLSGTVNISAGNNATLYSNGAGNTGGNWSQINSHFVIENNGNKNVSLELMSDKNAQQFIGGTNPVFQFNFTDSPDNTGACIRNITANWINVNTTSPGIKICNVLGSADSMDEIDINLKLVIPSDSLTGAQGSIFTATATSLG